MSQGLPADSANQPPHDGRSSRKEALALRLLARSPSARRRLALAARLGSRPAADALGIEPTPPPPFLDRFAVGEEAFLAHFQRSWEAIFIALSGALDILRREWALRCPELLEALDELHPLAQAGWDWFAGARRNEDALTALAWARSQSAYAELLAERPPAELGRAFSSFCQALGLMAYVGAPAWAPLRRGHPEGVPTGRDGTPLPTEAVRRGRLLVAREVVCDVALDLDRGAPDRHGKAPDETSLLRESEARGRERLFEHLLDAGGRLLREGP
ncbi:MAG: hypothetical protein D6731_25305 [Planctomycetota bacterium]|nr:MAG: hypothetical protein D6731_25305 [Planctomycetota bacterium]